MLEVGKKYSVIMTDIPYSRGLNGVGFMEYENATVLDAKDRVFKIVYECRDGMYLKVAYLFKDSIKSAQPYEKRFKCEVKKGNCYCEVELTKEENELNRMSGRMVIDKE